jgi:Protein of unknown function (DUF4230)
VSMSMPARMTVEARSRASEQNPASSRMMLRQRGPLRAGAEPPATGWRLHSSPLQTVRVNEASPSPRPSEPAPPAPVSGRRRWGMYTLALLFVAGAAFAGSALTTFAYQFFAGHSLAASVTTNELRGTNSVLKAIRDLATLESASYHMERVIDLRDRQSHMFGLFESQDAILLVASADVVAGIDLQGMRDGDVTFDELKRTAWITLPQPIVLSARLDSDKTYVHARSTDPLAVPAKTLETRARVEAERTLREAALEAGILGRARDNAALTIKTLLHSLGFDHVEVAFRAE